MHAMKAIAIIVVLLTLVVVNALELLPAAEKRIPNVSIGWGEVALSTLSR